MNAQAEILLDRAAELNHPQVVCGGNVIAGESSWRQAVEMPGHHSQLASQLDALEAEATRSAEQHARWAATDAERAARREPDLELAAAERAQAEASFARFERERPKRVEEKLDAIVSSLRVIAEGLAKR